MYIIGRQDRTHASHTPIFSSPLRLPHRSSRQADRQEDERTTTTMPVFSSLAVVSVAEHSTAVRFFLALPCRSTPQVRQWEHNSDFFPLSAALAIPRGWASNPWASNPKSKMSGHQTHGHQTQNPKWASNPWASNPKIQTGHHTQGHQTQKSSDNPKLGLTIPSWDSIPHSHPLLFVFCWHYQVGKSMGAQQ